MWNTVFFSQSTKTDKHTRVKNVAAKRENNRLIMNTSLEKIVFGWKMKTKAQVTTIAGSLTCKPHFRMALPLPGD